MSNCCCYLESNSAPKLFKALSDPNRLQILSQLLRRPEPQNVKDVCCCCNVDFSVVSRHLTQLKDAGILESERHGKEVRYRVRAGEVAKVLREIADALEAGSVQDE